MTKLTLTPEQEAVVGHDGSAFVSACPGAGKTRCIVERASKALSERNDGRGIAFLSFTNAAISELEERLIADGLLPSPAFPHFVGTFDRFIWHFLVEPFGLAGCNEPPRLIPDTGSMTIRPFAAAQELRLDCFDRETGKIIPEKARAVRFNRDPSAHETSAKRLRATLLEKGLLDFDDARRIAATNIADKDHAPRLAQVLSARFGEIIVDEAQDCNPEDLSIIEWLRSDAGIATKVVCDPHQSIYGFRKGVSDELFKYAETFEEKERLPLTGNFRSSSHICKAIQQLRAPSHRGDADEALGKNKDCDLPIQIFSYAGQGVSTEIGAKFCALAKELEIDPATCRLAAKTRGSGLRAIGAFAEEIGGSLVQRLAHAAMQFHHTGSQKDLLAAIKEAHIVLMSISGKLDGRTYHHALSDDQLKDLDWRGHVVKILKALRFDHVAGQTRTEWVANARTLLSEFVPPDGRTIAQLLPNQVALDGILQAAPETGISPRTIHEVKGKQYPGMCVVLTSQTAKKIINHIINEPDDDADIAENARAFYVAASRAEKLLVIACPKSQAKRLADHIALSGAKVEFTNL